jgi:phospholipid transport system substrate-binding protein
MKKWLTGLFIACFSITTVMATPQDAANQIKGNIQQVLNIINKDNGGNTAQVRKQAENYAIPYFDFTRMTMLAVGNNWKNASAAQKTALASEFKTLLIRTYSGTMMQYKNAKVNVKNNPQSRNDGKIVVVSTEVTIPSQSKPVQMDYTTYPSGNRYLVYNVTIEGASLVTVYRNQFNDIVAKKGVDGLIQELKNKNKGGK